MCSIGNKHCSVALTDSVGTVNHFWTHDFHFRQIINSESHRVFCSTSHTMCSSSNNISSRLCRFIDFRSFIIVCSDTSVIKYPRIRESSRGSKSRGIPITHFGFVGCNFYRFYLNRYGSGVFAAKEVVSRNRICCCFLGPNFDRLTK